MEWTRSEALALAMHNCAQCRGLGLRIGKKDALQPCNCVLRTIFRICFTTFTRLATQEKHLSRVSFEPGIGRERRDTWGRKNEEYVADFCSVSRRALDGFEHRLFRYHFLLGADWKLCSRRLGIDRGNFFHAVYRIQAKLGRMYRELEPYALFPVDEYFHGPSKIDLGVKWPSPPALRPADRVLPFPLPASRTA